MKVVIILGSRDASLGIVRAPRCDGDGETADRSGEPLMQLHQNQTRMFGR